MKQLFGDHSCDGPQDHNGIGSSGLPVAVLQMLLIAFGHADEDQQVNAIYEEVTAYSVRNLQNYLDIEADGNFDLKTRQAWEEEDFAEDFFDMLTIKPFRMPGVLVQADGSSITESYSLGDIFPQGEPCYN